MARGTNNCSFCYVDDEIDGIIKLLIAEDSEDIRLPVNIGNPHELTVEEIARKIIELTSSRSRIVYEPLPEDDPRVRRPDISRAERILGELGFLWKKGSGRLSNTSGRGSSNRCLPTIMSRPSDRLPV